MFFVAEVIESRLDVISDYLFSDLLAMYPIRYYNHNVHIFIYFYMPNTYLMNHIFRWQENVARISGFLCSSGWAEKV